MLYNAKNGTACFEGGTLDYIRFGTGRKNLLMLPGLGDGLRTVKGTALPMALVSGVVLTVLGIVQLLLTLSTVGAPITVLWVFIELFTVRTDGKGAILC